VTACFAAEHPDNASNTLNNAVSRMTMRRT
jgi:hypothetical protein